MMHLSRAGRAAPARPHLTLLPATLLPAMLLPAMLLPAALLAALSWLAACDGCAGPNGQSAATCTLPDGTELTVGQSAPAGDGCNNCICNGSVELVCGTRNCADAGPPIEDAGVMVDAGLGDDAGPGDGGVVDEGPCHDSDEDGYYDCVDPDYPARPVEVDCDDFRFHVQPLGIEFPDTTEDDNCNGTNDDWSNCDCGVATSAVDLAGAMDVCGPWVSGQQKSGGAGQFDVPEAYQGAIAGSLRLPPNQEPTGPPVIIGNSCELVMGTGDAAGTLLDVEPGSCNGSDPDPAGDTNSDVICDLASLTMLLDAPQNARGFAFDFMFLSHEWPEFLCMEYNDTFYASVESDAVNGGAPINAAFDSQGRPITVNVGFFEDPRYWTVPLEGTPFAAAATNRCSAATEPGCSLPDYCVDPELDVRRGSGSGWLTTTVPVVPGEQGIRLRFTIHDEEDQQYDSLVIIDGFRWLPHEVELGTEKGG